MALLFNMGIFKNLLILILLIVAIVMTVLFVHCQSKDSFCGACQGMGTKVCTNRELLHKLYNEGVLTEYTPQLGPDKFPGLPWDEYLSHIAKEKGLELLN